MTPLNQSESAVTEDLIACGILSTCCVFGLITNGGLIYATWKSKTFINPYGILCAIIGFLNCCFLATFTAFTVIPIIYDGIMEAKVGQIFNSIYYSIILLHILISVNRLCSISMPLKYMCIFGGKKSLLMALSMIAISAGFWFGSYFHWRCLFDFDKSLYLWFFEDHQCAEVFYSVNLYFQISMFIIILFIDIIAFRLILIWKKKTTEFKQSKLSNVPQLRSEIIFFSQTCVSSFIYAVIFIVGSIIEPLFTFDKWALFLLHTIVWVLGHAIDGVIIGFAQWNILLHTKKAVTIIVRPT
ncbi:unnamed protein product [Dracunculus medinensis]|uniref:7TM_GPCR_Srx domain-containing protein n=1 Tax=Dracunculus medinensis TaxID=318479 RepID=A0A0N4U829_DRAME|nr:unnamed protein product [Dracunculus medinensis]